MPRALHAAPESAAPDVDVGYLLEPVSRVRDNYSHIVGGMTRWRTTKGEESLGPRRLEEGTMSEIVESNELIVSIKLRKGDDELWKSNRCPIGANFRSALFSLLLVQGTSFRSVLFTTGRKHHGYPNGYFIQHSEST